MSSYLPSVRKQFAYYKLLAERTFAQLTDEQLQFRPDPNANSIAIIVGHLAGNMQSRFTDFLTTDGEKASRRREAEFEPELMERAQLLAAWEAGWTKVFAAIDPLQVDNLEQIVYIRNQGHTVLEAINRQLAHYAYHVGQIVYLGRLQLGEDKWQSLSVPRGGTAAFNAEKFSQDKQRGHFTDDFLDTKE